MLKKSKTISFDSYYTGDYFKCECKLVKTVSADKFCNKCPAVACNEPSIFANFEYSYGIYNMNLIVDKDYLGNNPETAGKARRVFNNMHCASQKCKYNSGRNAL